ncbi:MAG: hypothetical protein R3C68_06260 [Myxococcota bacterium]
MCGIGAVVMFAGWSVAWEVPTEWKDAAIGSRPTKKSPPPETWTPGEALHRLRPSVVERIETSYKMEAGAIGRGELGIRDFQRMGDNVYRVNVYIAATDYRGAYVGRLLEPLTQATDGRRLNPEEFASLVRVFRMLRTGPQAGGATR